MACLGVCIERFGGSHWSCHIEVIVFSENRQIPVVGRSESVLQSRYVLACTLVDGVGESLCCEQRCVASAEVGEHVVECEEMSFAQLVVDGGSGIPVVVGGTRVHQRLLSWRIEQCLFSPPVILIRGGIHVCRDISVVASRHSQVKTTSEEVVLHVFQARLQCMAAPMLLAIHDFLPHSRLYLLVHLRPSQSEEQSVGPFLAYHSQFSHYCLIVVCVVESLHALFLVTVYPTRLEVLHGRVDTIVVVGIILECRNLVCQSVFECLSETDVRLMGIE